LLPFGDEPEEGLDLGAVVILVDAHDQAVSLSPGLLGVDAGDFIKFGDIELAADDHAVRLGAR
jgi:hypothetical protein